MDRQIVDEVDWDALTGSVDVDGYAITPTPLLAPDTCRDLGERFDDDPLYRSTIDMARFNFGEGTYRYYRYPLPGVVAELREALYPRLAPLANRWQRQLGQSELYPDRLDDLVAGAGRPDRPSPRR